MALESDLIGITAVNAVYTLLHDLDPSLVQSLAEVQLPAKAGIPQRNIVIAETSARKENTSVRRKYTVAHS